VEKRILAANRPPGAVTYVSTKPLDATGTDPYLAVVENGSQPQESINGDIGMKSRICTLLAVALGFGFGLGSTPASEVAAQSSSMVRGVVREASTGAPLLDAQVRVVGTATAVTTDPQGRFRIPVSQGGRIEIEATRIGFAAERTSLLVGAGVVEVDFGLSPSPIQIPEVEVIGRSRDQVHRIPGSAEVVSQREILARVPTSGNEVLRSVAGIHVQEEEGLGLRANIGVRGLNPDRSRSVLILEDGVPVSLNPYGEPEMYYSPPIDRMERIEVVKGSGSIMFGPQTIGGVINYVTPSAPATPQGRVTVEGGTGSMFRALATYGGTWDNVGANVSLLHRRVGDIAGLFADVTDVTGKVGFGMGTKSRLGVKLSVYDEQSNSTYVGLTEAMFAADPYQHPAPDDRLDIRRYAASATHDYQLSSNATLRTLAFGYTTSRNWSRQNYAYVNGGTGVQLQPSTGNRNRSFEVWGVEPRLQWNHAVGGIRSETDAGVRAQREWAEDAHVDGSYATARSGNVRDYEERFGTAFSAFVQNRFFLTPEVQLTPGVRVERYSYERNILRTRVRRQNPVTGAVTRQVEDVDIRSGDDLFEVVPGIGLTVNPGSGLNLFAGVHRGFSPPRVKDALVYSDATVAVGADPGEIVSLSLDAERSVNVELGGRSEIRPGVALEATGFLLDFSNQIIPPSLSAGSVAQAQLANQGETRHIGVETSLWVDWGVLAALPVSVTTELKHTYVDATFSADRLMVNGRDTVNVRGNRLPYAPEHLLVAGVGVERVGGFMVRVDGVRVGDQFTDNFETVTPIPNGRTGLIPAYTVWNLSGSLQLPAGVTAFGSVKNLFDETYVASRRPEGIRPGLPRLLQIGLRAGI
jgi:Fe(3+) dicitrate transport protein